MPSSRPNLTLDEQSFQGLLSAAFIIQEHNDQRRRAGRIQAESGADRVGPHGDAPGDASRSESKGGNELRPGERLQHNWASMWLMSQERRLWPERSAEVVKEPILQEKSDAIHDQEERSQGDSELDDRVLIRPALKRPELVESAPAEPSTESRWTTEAIIRGLAPEEPALEDGDANAGLFGFAASDEFTQGVTSGDNSSLMRRFADWRVKLRFRRADLYLGTSIFLAALALLWPAAGSPRRAALSPWERALVTIGIAEAPAPVVHLQGDPNIEVWVDPHSALYYCPGEEEYGKTAGGRLSRQGDAQMDRFEPAGRSACE